MKQLFTILFLLMMAFSSLLAQRPTILTEDARTLGSGRVETGLGVEYLEKHHAPASDFPKSELRLFVTSTHFGVAENVDFNLDWRGRLRSQLRDGRTGSDWGDLTVATKINILEEHYAFPAIGVRSAVKLPNTAYLPYKLGSDQTDYYFDFLASKHIHHVETRLNLGLGIIGDPLAPGSQDDIYMYSVATIIPLHGAAWLFAELHGFTGHLDYDDKLVARLGASTELGGLQWNVYGSVRAAGDNRDFGTAFEASENWSVAVFLRKDFQI